LACANTLNGWVLNAEEGVQIHLEGDQTALEAFVRDLKAQPPPAASIAEIEVRSADLQGWREFTIRESQGKQSPTVRISPDLPVCADCLRELFDPADPRYLYPYINCTNCGPRYSVVLTLPYDRANTTMREWLLDDYCAGEYSDASNRRFHAQPVACFACGPGYFLHSIENNSNENEFSIERAADLLQAGKILGIKGLGGFHLACDARNPLAVMALRERKYRKEKPFAVMVRVLECAHALVELSPATAELLTSTARPIVLAPARLQLAGVAPGNSELGVMLPYTPLHHLLFAAGAPEVLVMTSANRASEPIAYEDEDALRSLHGIADSFLLGQRAIARRVDDSVVRASTCGPVILRRARGYAPGAVATLPTTHPILALGPDLKNTITLVIEGQAFVSQHLGDLNHYQSLRAFHQTIDDLISMYEVRRRDLLLVHDLHPEYFSTAHAASLGGMQTHAVQHHRAHIASVLAERNEFTKRVIGVAFDGTGYGDDGSIWGGEIFVGSVRQGFNRVAHLRSAVLAGGDAAAHHPVQAAAGFLTQIDNLTDLSEPPFLFAERFRHALKLIRKDLRTFATTSMGRLFDAAAALLGFTRAVTFEGQAAIWLEQLARSAPLTEPYDFPLIGEDLDFRPLLQAVIQDRLRGRDIREIARSFHLGISRGLSDALQVIARRHELETVVLSGGVFQNQLLLEDLKDQLEGRMFAVWTNHAVPPNDGGISLGQAALAAFGVFDYSPRMQCGQGE
jgi:hydrogenase maturation protein HypF